MESAVARAAISSHACPGRMVPMQSPLPSLPPKNHNMVWWLPAQGLWNQALAASLQDLPIQPSGSMTPSTLKHRISIISIKFYTLWYRQGHTYFPYIFLSLSMGSHRVGHDWSDLAVAAATFPWLIFSQQNPRNAHFSLSLSLSKCLSNVQLFATPWTVAHTAPCPLTTVFFFFWLCWVFVAAWTFL